MSFTRILYRLIIPEKITFSLNDIPKILDFLRDVTEGKYLTVIERHELEKFQTLAKRIDEKAELLPLVIELIDDKKKGREIKESLMEHRVLIHSLFYNKTHVLNQLSKIIDELEVQARMQESNNASCGVKVITQVGSALTRRER